MAVKKGREEEFLRWPKYKQLYINAFENMIKERIRRGKLDSSWRMGTTGKDVFNWWMEYDTIPGQMNIFDFIEDEDE
jgi:phosphoadenosine phosphosulfate reductase